MASSGPRHEKVGAVGRGLAGSVRGHLDRDIGTRADDGARRDRGTRATLLPPAGGVTIPEACARASSST